MRNFYYITSRPIPYDLMKLQYYFTIYHHMSRMPSTTEICLIISLVRTIMAENWKVGWPTTEVCLKSEQLGEGREPS